MVLNNQESDAGAAALRNAKDFARDNRTGARALHALGFDVIPLMPQSKRPSSEGWPDVRIKSDDELVKLFSPGGNVGILLGIVDANGHALIDIDLDDDRAVELADSILPPTLAVFGRESRPRSHRLYRVRGPINTRKFEGADGMIAEIRSTGCQTLAPGSIHPDGERVAWQSEDGLPLAGPAGEPAIVEPHQLTVCVEELARQCGGLPTIARVRVVQTSAPAARVTLAGST